MECAPLYFFLSLKWCRSATQFHLGKLHYFWVSSGNAWKKQGRWLSLASPGFSCGNADHTKKEFIRLFLSLLPEKKKTELNKGRGENGFI